MKSEDDWSPKAKGEEVEEMEVEIPEKVDLRDELCATDGEVTRQEKERHQKPELMSQKSWI